MTITLADAIALATQAHAGQLDKNGTPYINHPLAVMAMVTGEDEQIVAVLHDVLEDTRVTPDELAAAGVTNVQLTALCALTHLPHENYVHYVQRALNDPIGRVVKIADFDHNYNPERLALLDHDTAKRLRKKYARVAPLIEAARKG